MNSIEGPLESSVIGCLAVDPVADSGFGSFEPIVDDLVVRGWCTKLGFLASAEVDAIRGEAAGLLERGAFHPAGVGRGQDLALRPAIRADRIHWVDPQAAGPAVAAYLARLDALRQAINRDLFLGLAEFEGHLAIYPRAASIVGTWTSSAGWSCAH